jgi:hypothetical protein
MSKYRTNTHDAAKPIKPKSVKPGIVPENKVAVVDHKNRMRGQVGRLATSVTASRFLNGRPASLQTVNGQQVWKETLAEVSAAGTAQPGSTADSLAGASSRGATATIIKGGQS